MFRPELFKEQWPEISPKIREVFPSLSSQDVQDINGNIDVLVAKVSEKNQMKREEILAKVTPLLKTPAEKAGTTHVGR